MPTPSRRAGTVGDKERAQRKKRSFGVIRVESRSCWMARIEKRYLGQFETEEDAAVAFDRVARHLRIDRSRWNFPERKLEPATVEDIRREQRAKFKKGTSSSYTGVAWDKTRSAWVAIIEHEGRRLNLGLFQVEAEAAQRYDEVAFALKGNKGPASRRPADHPGCAGHGALFGRQVGRKA